MPGHFDLSEQHVPGNASRGQHIVKEVTPRVSVLLPNLNNRPFLEERFQTVLNQTFVDWEMIVVDNYSDDGAWELIQEFAERDARIRIYRAPREGMYANWNNCIRLARGEYVYIATSDDTMTPDCLEEMVVALDAHPDCALAHCCLTIIDQDGNELEGQWLEGPRGRFLKTWIDRKHVRLAPYDGILCCAVGTVYHSITQLLVRRILFETIGYFKTGFGSMGDVEWGLRAGLVCNTVHVPRYLATWRVHSEQATQQALILSSQGRKMWCEMIESAMVTLRALGYRIATDLDLRTLTFCYRFQQLEFAIRERSSTRERLWFLARFSLSNLDVAVQFLAQFLTRKRFDCARFIERVLIELGFGRRVQLL